MFYLKHISIIIFRCLAKENEFNFDNSNMQSLRKKMSSELFEGELTPDEIVIPVIGDFSRRISNPDGVTCWLNSMIQLILNALDHQNRRLVMVSALGQLLENFQEESLIDPRPIKNLIQHELDTNAQRNQQISTDQECARDALIILTENENSWPDVYELLHHKMRQTRTCHTCNSQFSFDIDQLYSEVLCPQNNVSLKQMLEDTVNKEERVELLCDTCQVNGEASINYSVVTESSSEFLIIQIKRAEENYNNNVTASEDVTLVDSAGVSHTYTPISIIHHRYVGSAIMCRAHFLTLLNAVRELHSARPLVLSCTVKNCKKTLNIIHFPSFLSMYNILTPSTFW